eukprot:16438078-Heterocapsa_arctica.AAC.1
MSNVKSNRLDEVLIPVMPIDRNHIQIVHRPKVNNNVAIWNAMVVRTVTKKEISGTPDAQLAMDHEYNKLEKKGVGPPHRPREVCGNGRGILNHVKCQFGMVFGICGEKGSELKRSDPGLQMERPLRVPWQ